MINIGSEEEEEEEEEEPCQLIFGSSSLSPSRFKLLATCLRLSDRATKCGKIFSIDGTRIISLFTNCSAKS
jgi:hypothetical protein